MRNILVVVVLFLLVSCGGGDQFATKAYRLKAEQGLKEIRNALSVYNLKNGRYPEEYNWKEEILPYFRRERIVDPQKLSQDKMLVMGAKNNIAQVKGIMQSLKRKVFFANKSLRQEILSYILPIDSSLALASYEVAEAERYEFLDITAQIEGLQSLLVKVDVSVEKKAVLSEMEKNSRVLSERINDLKNELVDYDLNRDTLDMVFNTLDDVIKTSLLIARGKKDSFYNLDPSCRIKILIDKLDSKEDSLVISNLKHLGTEISSNMKKKNHIDFLSSLVEFRKKLPASIKLFNDFYNENREKVLNSNKKLTSYGSLNNLRSLLSLYESENDTLPKGNLYDVFKEDIDMKEIREDLSSDPYLYKEDYGYRLEATAIDAEKTVICRKVRFINTYDDIVQKSFSSAPNYETDDSGTTFFVLVKAKDREQTVLTSRPKFRKKE